jgi:hypothetical protein
LVVVAILVVRRRQARQIMEMHDLRSGTPEIGSRKHHGCMIEELNGIDMTAERIQR